jgi:hypothetical protein
VCATTETVVPAAAWPKDVARETDVLQVTWADTHVSRYPYPELRALCRCATCMGGH